MMTKAKKEEGRNSYRELIKSAKANDGKDESTK